MDDPGYRISPTARVSRPMPCCVLTRAAVEEIVRPRRGVTAVNIEIGNIEVDTPGSIPEALKRSDRPKDWSVTFTISPDDEPFSLVTVDSRRATWRQSSEAGYAVARSALDVAEKHRSPRRSIAIVLFVVGSAGVALGFAGPLIGPTAAAVSVAVAVLLWAVSYPLVTQPPALLLGGEPWERLKRYGPGAAVGFVVAVAAGLVIAAATGQL